MYGERSCSFPLALEGGEKKNLKVTKGYARLSELGENIFQVHHKGLCVFFLVCCVCELSPPRGKKKKKISELDGDFHESITAKFHTELPGEVAKSPRVKF